MLIFAAALKAAQHQENIDHVGLGAGTPRLQFDVVEFERAQLQRQLGQIGGLPVEEARVSQAQQLLLFCVQLQILINALDDGRLEESDLMNLVQKIVQLALDRGEKD